MQVIGFVLFWLLVAWQISSHASEILLLLEKNQKPNQFDWSASQEDGCSKGTHQVSQ